MHQKHIVFNGIDATTGQYLQAPMAPESLARIVRGERLDPQEIDELEQWLELCPPPDPDPKGTKAGVDPCFLEESGWGIVFPRRADPAVRETLRPLLELRREQAAKRHDKLYREISGEQGYRPGESKSELDVQYAVGRLHFDAPEDYARYAENVVEAETGRHELDRRVAFFGVQNSGDVVTRFTTEHLIEPLARLLRGGQKTGRWRPSCERRPRSPG